MGALDLSALQGPNQPRIVVARYAQGDARLYHAHDQREDAGGIGPAVHQIADKDGLAPRRRLHLFPGDAIPQPGEQGLELGATPVYIADDVKRTALLATVGPQLLPHHFDPRHVCGRAQGKGAAKALALEALEAAAQLTVLSRDHVGRQVAVGALGRTLLAEGSGYVEDDGYRLGVIALGQFYQRLARLGLDVGRIDHGQKAPRQAASGDKVQRGERIACGLLAVFVVRDQAAKKVCGEHLGREEVRVGKGRFARARDAD